MQRSHVAAALLAVAHLTAGGVAAETAARTPRAVIEPAERDLGVVGVGEEAVAEFRVRNDGGSTLELAAVEAPQGVRVEGVPASLAAGGSAVVRARIDTEALAGPLALPLTLRTNDPERAELRASLKAEVRPFLQVHPGYARYITVRYAREGTIAQTIGAADGAAFRVLEVQSPAPYLRLSFREARADERRPGWSGSQWRVESTLAADAPVGALTGSIVVRTDHPRQRRARIPVSGFVRPVFAVTPPEARLGDVDPKRTPGARLLIKNFAEEPIELTSAGSDVPGVRAELTPLTPGRSWRLRLVFAPDMPAGPFAGKVQVRAANPHVPLIEVPFSGRIAASAPAPSTAPTSPSPPAP